MTQEELDAKLKQIIKDKTPTDVSYITFYLLPVIEQYAKEYKHDNSN